MADVSSPSDLRTSAIALASIATQRNRWFADSSLEQRKLELPVPSRSSCTSSEGRTTEVKKGQLVKSAFTTPSGSNPSLSKRRARPRLSLTEHRPRNNSRWVPFCEWCATRRTTPLPVLSAAQGKGVRRQHGSLGGSNARRKPGQAGIDERYSRRRSRRWRDACGSGRRRGGVAGPPRPGNLRDRCHMHPLRRAAWRGTDRRGHGALPMASRLLQPTHRRGSGRAGTECHLLLARRAA